MSVVSDYAIRAKKAFGQNFLVDDAALSSIARAIDVEGQDVVEIGPGYGALTERLLSMRPKSLTLVELDPDMVRILKDRLSKGDLHVPEGTAFRILESDVLKYVPEFERYRIIANIPYYITSPIFDRFFYGLPVRPEFMVILMQKEVSERILAKEGKESGLSLFCKNACQDIELVARVPAWCFRPAPKVDSAALRFSVAPLSDPNFDKRLLQVVRAGFSSPRKKAASNLSSGLGVPKDTIETLFGELAIRLDERPERISLENWRVIASRVSF